MFIVFAITILSEEPEILLRRKKYLLTCAETPARIAK